MSFYFKLGKNRSPRLDLDLNSNSIEESLENKNCLQCQRFSYCKNEHKAYNFVCDEFKAKSIQASQFGNSNYDLVIPTMDLGIPTSKKLITSGTIDLNDVGFEKLTDDQFDSFNMDKIIQKVQEDFKTGLSRDLKIDLSDLPRAKNFVDYVINPRFTKADVQKPWAKQIRYVTKFLGEICHNPKCTNLDYLENLPVDASIDQMLGKITFLEHGKCPRCHKNKLEQQKEFGLRHYTSSILILGQRSGKTAGVNRLLEYYFHQWLILPRPQRVFSVEDSQSIEFSFTATTYTKALKNIFNPLSYKVRNGPWFKEYHEALDHYGQKYGEELYKLLDHSLVYRHQKYHVYAEPPNPQNMRGATRGFVAIDELSHLFARDKQAVRLNPEEVLTSLENSLSTLRMAYNRLVKEGQYQVPVPIMPNITSPRTFNDLGMQLLRESRLPNSMIYGEHGSVYEYNPNAEGDPDLAQIQRKNPERFKRDFLAIPPNAANAFITNMGAIQGCIVKDHSNAIQLKDYSFTGQRKSVKLQSANVHIVKNKKINTTTPKVLTIDGGAKWNSFAIVVSHNEIFEEDGYEKLIHMVDAVGEIIPRDDHTLSYSSIMEEVIFELVEEFNVAAILADRWNSLQLLQSVEDEFEIYQRQYSLKYGDFINFRRDLYEGQFGFPMAEGLKMKDLLAISSDNYPMCFHNKPIAHFFFQCMTVEDILNKTVDKGTGYTDDIFRAMVLNHWALNDDEILEVLDAAENKTPTKQTFTGAVGSLGGTTMLLGGGQATTTSSAQTSNGMMRGKHGFAGAVGSSTPIGGTSRY